MLPYQRAARASEIPIRSVPDGSGSQQRSRGIMHKRERRYHGNSNRIVPHIAYFALPSDRHMCITLEGDVEEPGTEDVRGVLHNAVRSRMCLHVNVLSRGSPEARPGVSEGIGSLGRTRGWRVRQRRHGWHGWGRVSGGGRGGVRGCEQRVLEVKEVPYNLMTTSAWTVVSTRQ